MNPEYAYIGICNAPDPEKAVRELTDATLKRLIPWLEAGHRQGVPALVLALAELQAARRFVQAP